MKKLICILLSIIICCYVLAGCTDSNSTLPENSSDTTSASQDDTDDINSNVTSSEDAVSDGQTVSSITLPDNLEMHKAVSAQETFDKLSNMDKTAGCEYIYNQYIRPAERSNLLGKEWDDGTLSDKYIFYFAMNVVFHNIEYFRDNFPDGNEPNTVCVPEDIVEDYINQFILEADNLLLRSESFNSHYNENLKGYDFFVAETGWMINSTKVTDYIFDKEKLVVTYDILPIDGEETITKTAVFNVEDGLYKLYQTYNFTNSDSAITSKDGTHSIITEYTGFRGESSEVHIIDNKTGESNLVDTFIHNLISDVGFFSNGDIYVMDYTGLRVFNYKNNMTSKEPVFTTSTNFPAGGVIKDDGTERYIFAIRRDPDNFDYIVVYGEYIEDEDYYVAHPNDFQLAYNYKIGLLDKEGNLTKSWDTGVPIMFNVFGFENVVLTKIGEDEILISAHYKNEQRFKGRFNLSTGTYSSIKEFKVP